MSLIFVLFMCMFIGSNRIGGSRSGVCEIIIFFLIFWICVRIYMGIEFLVGTGMLSEKVIVFCKGGYMLIVLAFLEMIFIRFVGLLGFSCLYVIYSFVLFVCLSFLVFRR